MSLLSSIGKVLGGVAKSVIPGGSAIYSAIKGATSSGVKRLPTMVAGAGAALRSPVGQNIAGGLAGAAAFSAFAPSGGGGGGFTASGRRKRRRGITARDLQQFTRISKILHRARVMQKKI